MDDTEAGGLDEVRELVRDYEVRTKRSYHLYFLSIFFGVLMIAAFAYSQLKAEEARRISESLFQSAEQSELTQLLDQMIDKKIDLLRQEIKLRYNITGALGGVMLGVGVAGLLGYQRRCRQIRAMRSVIDHVGKDY